MPKVSVVMPSLNVAPFIRQCIDSVINQTLNDIEIIAVDAGSTDGTLEILREYEKSNNRVRVIVSDKRSYGYQMNLGFAAANGEYIGIVETDDHIPADTYSQLYSYAIENDLDYVKGYAKLFYEFEDKSVFNISSSKFEKYDDFVGKIIAPSSNPELLVQDYYIWNGIYKKTYVKNTRFNETNGAAFQDQGFLLKTLSTAQKSAYLDVHVYNYRQSNPNSSIYNKNGFKYIQQEYSFNMDYVLTLSNDWQNAFYTRMIDQTAARIRVIASSGESLDTAHDEICFICNTLKHAYVEGKVNDKNMSSRRKMFFQTILDDPQKLYDYFKNEIIRKKNKMDSILNKVGEADLIIFSYGYWGKIFYIISKHIYGNNVVAFCDNNADIQGMNIDSISVVSPEQAVMTYPNAYYVIANMHHYDKIYLQLRKLGIPEEKIIRYIFEEETMLLNCSYIKSNGKK